MRVSTVPAGTVLYLDFANLGLEKPHFTEGHPVVVVNTEGTQRRTGIAFAVPLTSALGNHDNTDAVEVTNATFVRTSPTGRSFAICDKMTSIPLQQLEPYLVGRRMRRGQNRVESYQIGGEDLRLIRIACTRLFWPDDVFRRSLSSDARSWLSRLFSRQGRSRGLGRKAGPVDLVAD